jgi:hypothetical protein
MANEFTARNGLIAQKDSVITGSLIVTNGITGSLLGTASYATQALSSSFASTYTPVFPYTGSARITGSLIVTGSFKSLATNTNYAGYFQNNAYNLGGNNPIIAYDGLGYTVGLGYGTSTDRLWSAAQGLYIGGHGNFGVYFERSGFVSSGKARIGDSNFNTGTTLELIGTGATSATSTLLVQNSSAVNLFKILNDGTTTISGSLVITGSLTGSLVVNGLIIGKGKNTLDNVYINTNGSSITTGVQNYCIGTSAGTGITSGIYNVCIGHTAGVSINSGASNITIGRQAGGRITTGTGNLAIGETSMYYNNTGNYNSAYGTLAMLGTDGTANSNNTAIGAVCAYTIAAGSNNNVFVGYQAARYISGGVTAIALVSASVFLGMNTMPLASSQTNQIVIGYSATGLGSNTAVIGNDSIITTALKGNILIGTTTDAGYKLDVVGTSRLNGNSNITGSLNVTGGITGSLLGTASYATQALSASYAPSTSTFPFTGSAIITGSLSVIGTTIAGFNPTPLTGSIRDGVTSVLGDLQDWDSQYYSGEVLYSELSGEDVNFGNICYREASGRWLKASGFAVGEASINMLGIALNDTTGPVEPLSILTRGYVETTYASVLATGEPLYMTTSPGTVGRVTYIAPSSAGNIVRLIGNTFWDSSLQTNTKNIIYFNPDNTWIEL